MLMIFLVIQKNLFYGVIKFQIHHPLVICYGTFVVLLCSKQGQTHQYETPKDVFKANKESLSIVSGNTRHPYYHIV